jgi:mRNA-degrading endonuclease RelE of RelBE toxin-antitoxin system
MGYSIVYSPEAVEHLSWLAKDEQVKVLDEVEKQLAHDPTLPTRRRKVLRPNVLAPWQLRIDDIRVFYDVQDEPTPLVAVKAIGKKVHNELWIAGERIEL